MLVILTTITTVTTLLLIIGILMIVVITILGQKTQKTSNKKPTVVHHCPCNAKVSVGQVRQRWHIVCSVTRAYICVRVRYDCYTPATHTHIYI